MAAATTASGVTPLEHLLTVMRNENETQERRLDAAKAAAPYVHARLSSVDMTAKSDNTIRLISGKPMTEDEWSASLGGQSRSPLAS